MEYPVCVGGKRRCPPDDCGGTWAYADLLAILADPRHSEHREMLEWLCIEDLEEWDPEEFDLHEVNEALREPYGASIFS